MQKLIAIIVLVGFLSGCDFEVPGADEKFGTQNFVSAVSIIELHKLRNGVYVVVKLNWPRFCIQASIFALTRSVSAHRYIDAV
ncbi:hypothetical protein [Shewanella algae]|uniref:hypothetical protein n=1 Tax=Shewanella algae TaxID=38313 RepID=UPI0031F488A8